MIGKNCAVCDKPIKGHDPHIEIEKTGKVYHTCKPNPTCYQVWLQDAQQERQNAKTNDLCNMFSNSV